ncbi:uncharacterized protein BO88DRAFT_373447 [Aspergillus vadensis CBS 113365]|uniref:BTB domain transcription factor n=1 Tax=Aspergillus vadensis (strain CBS 113365 / IMI 142717 / IBT 24658) TaxID=1448311 RepID=A0A319AXK4_ASPVC|nr:hypothetical protein BO88DRAFT_373447 [Aspergillus vadensis CBS 113365]PYH65116.1 hypothetical protein BO88DRAFT_373447 [Aspergillus vadensis CBS 113365]
MTEILESESLPTFQPQDGSRAFTSQPRNTRGDPGISSGAGTVPLEGNSPTIHKHEANADVVLPYSIEEPDDEPAEAAGQTTDKPVIRLLVGDNSEIWQGELVDSMEGLQCDSDQSASQTRGKKRKPSATATGSSRPFRRSSSDSIPNAQRDEPNEGPKRRRRKGRCARDYLSPGMFWQHDGSDTTSLARTGWTLTSTRQAAQKAKEAIAAAPDVKSRGPAGAKRKETTDKGPAPKKGKKEDDKVKPEKDQQPTTEDEVKTTEELAEEPEKPESKSEEAPEKPAEEEPQKTDEEPAAAPAEPADKAEDQPKPDEKPEEKPEKDVEEKPEEKSEEKREAEPETKEEEKPAPAADGAEAGVKTSQEREEKVASNVLEKGIIYFFYRPRVNVTDPQSVSDVARSFLVLRPTPIGATLNQQQGSVEPGAKCRLLMLPKKKFPTSGKERDMGFVEKAGQSMKSLQESFIAGDTYETSTRGERTVPEARPFAEGVYAITSTTRASHLAYVLTIPETIGSIQEDFGLHSRGSWVIQSKNPKYPGPSYAQIQKDPEYPESVREKFGDYRWVPLQPEFIDYPNAQFLMIGEATDDLGKAATAEEGDKQANEAQPGEELEKLEQENEERIEALRGDDTIYEDLGLDAKNYPKVPTTWSGE